MIEMFTQTVEVPLWASLLVTLVFFGGGFLRGFAAGKGWRL